MQGKQGLRLRIRIKLNGFLISLAPQVGPQKGFEYLLGMNLWSLTHEKVPREWLVFRVV